MTASRKPRVATNQQQAARMLGTTPAKIRLANKRGAPGFRSGRIYVDELLQWLRAKKAKGDGPPKKPKLTGPRPDKGSIPALNRLAAEEAELSQRLAEAKQSGDSEVESITRGEWLKVGDSLRRHDLATRELDRQTGETISRNDAENHIKVLGWAVHMGTHELGRLSVGLAGQPADIIYAELSKVWGALMAAMVTYAKSASLPEWVTAAFQTDMFPGVGGSYADSHMRLWSPFVATAQSQALAGVPGMISTLEELASELKAIQAKGQS